MNQSVNARFADANQLLRQMRENYGVNLRGWTAGGFKPARELAKQYAASHNIQLDGLHANNVADDIIRPITDEDKAFLRQKFNIKRLRDLKFDHIDGEKERDALRQTIAVAEKYIAQQPGEPGLSLVLTAELDKSHDLYSGLGCGKTHIATAIAWALHSEMYWTGNRETTVVRTNTKIFQVKTLIGRFDDPDWTIAQDIPRSTSCIVLDDVGREGTLRFERRDPDAQTAELQARYFTLIDYCVSWGISVVITANLLPNQLREHVGLAAWDRLLAVAPAGFIRSMDGIRSYRPYLGNYR